MDSRITPELKTTYGYDSEGHVTALTAPGQESWAITYGLLAGDATGGRALKVLQAPASAPLWAGTAPQNIEAPRITGTPAVGTRLAVSDGGWSGNPITYGYQWEDCNTAGAECVAISGATNANYTPTEADTFHTVTAVVTATNGGGSVSATAHVVVAPGAIHESTLPSGSGPLGTASGADGNVWFTDSSTDKIGKITMAGAVTEYALPAGSKPFGIAAGPDGNLWFVDYSTSKIGKATISGAVTEYALPAGSNPYEITSGPDGNLWFTDSGTGKIGRITTSGTITEWWYLSGSRPYGITWGPDGNLWFTDIDGSTVGKITTAGIMTEYALPSGSGPTQIAVGSDGKLWFAEYGSSKIGKITTSGAVTEYTLPAGSNPIGIAAGSDKNLWFADYGSSRIGRITTTGTIAEAPLPAGSHPYWMTSGPDGNPWFACWGTGKIGKVVISGIAEISEFALPSSSNPYGIVTGSDGNLWFTNEGTSKIGKATTSGVTTEYALPAGSNPIGIVSGPDKNLWFADYSTNKIGKITTAGVVTEYTVPAGSNPAGIASGSDGNLWFTDYSTSRIGKITTSGTVTEYALPSGSNPWGVTAGPDKNLWFGERGTNKIGKITTSGVITEYSLPAGSNPYWLTSGPDGNIWFPEFGTSKIGKITTTGTITEYALPAGSGPVTIADGPENNLWFSDYGSGKTGVISTAGAVSEYTMPTGSGTYGITTGPDNNIWITDEKTFKIAKMVMSGAEFALPSSSNPYGIVTGSDGNLWFTNEGTSKIGKATTSGVTTEYALPAGSNPIGIVSGPDKNLWFADYSTNKIGKITTAGVVTEYTVPAGSNPAGIASGSDGNLWFTDYSTSRIGKITTSGTVTEYALPSGSNPWGVTAGPDKNLWFGERGTNKIGKITTSGVITEYSLPAGSNPYWLTSGPDGNIWFPEFGTSKIGKITTTGTITEYALPAGSGPVTIADGPENNLWFSDYGSGKTGVISTAGAVSEYTMPTGSGTYGITTGPDNNIWITDEKTFKIGVVLAPHSEGEHRNPESGMTVEYNVPLSGVGLPNMTAAEVKKGWGQEDAPVEATAVFSPGEAQSWPASDYRRATITYFDAQGRSVNTGTPAAGITTTEYNQANDVVRTLSASNRVAALKEGAKSAEAAKAVDTESKYNSEGTELMETVGPRHLVKLSNGKEVQARSRTLYYYDEGAPAEGGPYHLVTKTTQGAEIEGEAEQDVRTTTTSYSGQSNLGWKLRRPTAIVADPTGLKITHTTLYDEASGNVIETRAPKSPGPESPHDTRTIYYSAGTNSVFPACGEHAEWANLRCETLAAKQPETPGLPALPASTATYNMYGEPLTTVSVVGSDTRTQIASYDEAGRLTSSEATSTVGAALPKVTYKYSEATGALTTESTVVGAEVRSLESKFNTLGQLSSYVDADSNESTYEYENGGEAHLEKVNDGKGVQTYGYDETTGKLMEVVDSAAGKFTATYDVEGNVTGEGYPNGMKAIYSRDAAGNVTGLIYKKETHCSEKCEWFSENVSPSIHGQWLGRSNNLGQETYVFDGVGRLTEARVTPTAKGCVTRRYAYDEDTNRTNLTTYEPNAKGECASEHSTIETHSYDPADRLTDSGVGYDAFGNTTTLPAVDAGKFGLTTSFYVDNQVKTEEQNGQAIGYSLDPAHRTREVVSTGKIVATETVHYASAGNTPAWTAEASGNWTRTVPGLDGLAAIQHNGEAPILQLPDLRGDIVATAYLSETATGWASTIGEATEYGVPGSEAPPKYSWLGAHEIPTELPSGVTSMNARSYVPELGRFLQGDPVSGGSANAYAYTNGDPLNETDLTGMYVEASYITGFLGEEKVRAIEREVAREAAARAEAEARAAQAAREAAIYASMEAEGSEYEEYEEEEEEGEYVAFRNGAGSQSTNDTEPPAQNEEGGVFFAELSGASEANGYLAKCGPRPNGPQANARYAVCVRSVGFLGDLVTGAKNLIKSGAKAVVKAAKKIVKWIKVHAAEVHEVSCLVQGIGVGTLVGVGATTLSGGIGLYAGGVIGGTAGSAVTYACEHEV